MERSLLLLVAVVAFANAAKSALVLDNIANTSGDSTFVGDTDWLAQGFETSAGSWTLDDVVVRVGGNSTNVFVAIYADSGIGSPASAPGGVLETLSGQSSFSTGPVLSNITYTSSGLSLAGNTLYWIVVGAGSGSTMFWSSANNATMSTAIWSLPSGNTIATSSDDGSSWNPSSFVLNFSINATSSAAVPEPGTWAAAALLAGGAAFARWRRRRESK
jgi:hypothetical protein